MSEANQPTKDFFGDEIWPDDTYYKFGKDVVVETNLKRYLIEIKQVECYQA